MFQVFRVFTQNEEAETVVSMNTVDGNYQNNGSSIRNMWTNPIIWEMLQNIKTIGVTLHLLQSSMLAIIYVVNALYSVCMYILAL